jgi:hypothetical protein
MNELLSYVAWMKFTNITLIGKYQREKTAYFMAPFT